jgi:hypothetical protein
MMTKAKDKKPVNESKVAEAEMSKVSVASSVGQEGQETKTITVARTICKDFMLSGMIGGTSESALSLVSLQFEIEKARKMGHSDVEICDREISRLSHKREGL